MALLYAAGVHFVDSIFSKSAMIVVDIIGLVVAQSLQLLYGPFVRCNRHQRHTYLLGFPTRKKNREHKFSV